MVISKWIKVYSDEKNYDKVDLFYPFKYSPFLEGWARIATVNNKDMPLSLVGVTKSSKDTLMYKGYVFDRLIKSAIEKEDGDYSLKDAIDNGIELVFNSRAIVSKVNIYEVMLKADIKLKNLGIEIKDLEYNIEGKYV